MLQAVVSRADKEWLYIRGGQDYDCGETTHSRLSLRLSTIIVLDIVIVYLLETQQLVASEAEALC